MHQFDVKKITNWLQEQLAPVSSETLGWLAIILFHSATIPSLLAILTGLSDRLPSIDMVLLTWAGLGALFAQAAVNKNFLSMITITIGFMIQAGLMALIFFK